MWRAAARMGPGEKWRGRRRAGSSPRWSLRKRTRRRSLRRTRLRPRTTCATTSRGRMAAGRTKEASTGRVRRGEYETRNIRRRTKITIRVRPGSTTLRQRLSMLTETALMPRARSRAPARLALALRLPIRPGRRRWRVRPSLVLLDQHVQSGSADARLLADSICGWRLTGPCAFCQRSLVPSRARTPHLSISGSMRRCSAHCAAMSRRGWLRRIRRAAIFSPVLRWRGSGSMRCPAFHLGVGRDIEAQSLMRCPGPPWFAVRAHLLASNSIARPSPRPAPARRAAAAGPVLHD